MNSYKRYDRETIESIGVGLTQYNSASELAKQILVKASTKRLIILKNVIYPLLQK